MKKLNLFSDLWSSVAGSQRNDVEFDRRLTVGSPSGFTMNWTLKLVSVLVLVLTIGIGNVWGATAKVDDFLWREQFTGTTTSTSTTFSASTAATISALANSSKGTSMLDNSDISGLSYTASNVMVTASTGANCSGAHIWVNKKTTGYFQVTGIPVYNATKIKILWNQGGASSCTASYKLDNGSWTNAKTTTSAGADISSNEISVSGKTTISIKFTRTSTNTNIRLDDLRIKVTEVAAAGTSVSLTKAGETNGTITLSPASSVTTTGAAGVVTVTATPDAGYYLSNLTATNPTTGTATVTGSGNTRTVTYSSGANGSSTITATFSPIWYLKGDFNSWGATLPLTDITSNVATVDVGLSKTTAYEFKVYNAQEDAWYGDGGKIIDDISGWEFSTSKDDNCTIFATVADDYTFKFNTSNHQVQVIYPDMTHPNDAYVYLTKWWDCYVHYWYTDGGGDHALSSWGSDLQLSRYEEICETDYWCVPILDGYPKLIMKDNAGDPSNTTGDQTTASNAGKYITHNGSAWVWNTFGTYTITFAGNGNTGGSMSNVTGICPNGSTTLAANGYTKTGYTFSGWKTNVAVTANGSPVAANGIVPAGATISSINSNITLTAQWSANVYTVTSTLSNCTSDPAIPSSYTYTGSAANVTYTISPSSGYRLPTSVTVSGSTYTWDSGTGKLKLTGTITSNVSITVTAVQTHMVDWYVGGTAEENKLTTGSQTIVVDHNSKVTTLPSTPSGAACDLTFIGWTNTTSYTHGTSTLFTTAAGSPAVTSATKYYAVFAAGSAPATKSLTNAQITTFYGTADNRAYANGPFTIASTDGNWYGVCAAGYANPNYYVSIKSELVEISSANYLPYLRSPEYSSDIVSVSITHNSDVERTILICSSATATPASDKIASISVTSSNKSGASADIPSGVNQIYLYSDNKAIPIKSIDVSVGGYSGYTLTCEACATSVTPTFTASPEGGTVAVSKSGAPVSSGTAVKTCSGVALTVTITPDSHHKLTNFTATGLTTGTATISPSVATTLATPQASAQTFTVTLSDGAEGTLNLTPTFSENAYRTVVFVNNNTKLFDDNGEATTFDATNKWKQKVYVGEKPVLPTALIASQACDDNSTTFMGWVRDNQRWPGKSASSMPTGSTLITAASGFDAAAAGSGEIAYHAVWAQENLESDVINRSATSSKLGSTSTSTWVSAWDLTGSTGAKYTIYSMGTTGGTQALQWNSNGYLYCKTAPTSGKKLYSIAVTGTDNKNVGLYAQNSAYSTNSGGTSLGTLATGSTYTFTDEYGYIRITGTASSTQITTLTITYGSYTNYMTTCCGSTGLTLYGPTGDMVFITSAAEKKVRSQEAFHISGCGVSGSTTVTFDFGSSALNAKFTCATATGGALVTTCDGRIDEDFYIYYTPGAGDTSDGIDKSTSLTASVGGTLSANVTLATKTIIGRHLPADFVIAGKKNGKWYALPATMESTAHPAPVEIAVDDANNPSTAYTTASNKYGLEGPAAGNISDGDGQYVKLTMHPLSDAPLFGQAPSNTGIGKSGTAVATNKLSAGWWWKLEQINTSITNPQDAKYNIYCANNTSSLSIKDNAGNPEWGLYASGVDELRLIPVNAIEFTESEVVAWGQEKLILEVALPVGATQARAKLGDGSWSANKSLATTTGTSVNGTATKYNYTLDFTDEIDFSEAASEGKMLVVELLNSGGTALKATSVLIPKIVAANRTIKKATDAAKGPWNTEVHVLPGATLTIDASGYSPADMTIAELNIYPGAAVVAENGTLKATTLVLRNGWDRLSETKKYDVARLFITSSTGSLQTTTAYSDWYIDFDQYYPIAVPWTVTTSAMTYKNTSSAASAGVKMRYYDGASRASNVQNGVGESENWKVYDVDDKAYPATLTPGVGYAMTAKRPTGKAFSIVRMPLTIPSADWTAGGEQGNVSTTHKDQVSVTAHGNENTPIYAKGWNFIANPYMSLYQGALSYANSETVEYANIPDENFKEFDQQPILTTKLKPSSAFLIQAPTTGTVTFVTDYRKASAPQRYSNGASENEMQIQRAYILLGDDQTEDMMGILVSEKYTADYELNADLEKLLSDGNTLRTYMRYNDMNMAYLTINEELAKQLIPVSVRIPADGEYTFRIHEASIADELEGIYLTDYQTGTTTNLLYDSYTFNAVAGTDNVRFAINAVIGKREVPTGVDISGSAKDRPTKFIWNDKVYILHNNVIYDSTGKRVNVINK